MAFAPLEPSNQHSTTKMAFPPKSSKQTSRWGFLQQAVASVESHLDTILADEDEPTKKNNVQAPPAKGNATPKRASTDLSRSNSGAQTNDRLQERLARAMAKKSASRTESPVLGSEPTSAVNTPDIRPAGKDDGFAEGAQTSESLSDGKVRPSSSSKDDVAGLSICAVEQVEAEIPQISSVEPPALSLSDLSPIQSEAVASTLSGIDLGVSRADQADRGKSSTEYSKFEAERKPEYSETQEEINGYIERIDALQAKLQYMTKEAVDSAKQASVSVPAGSVERKLLEREEKIALLMEEGQKLSKSEMKHITTIRKLKSQAIASSKEQSEIKSRTEKTEKSLCIAEERALSAEASARRAEENLISSLAASRDLEAVTNERNALKATLADMRGQLSRANSRAEAAETKAQSDMAEKERKRNEELQETLTDAKIEKELSEEKLRREISDLKASLEREKEHSRVMETEMLGEQAVLESKLESFRTRVEEASSNKLGDVQANLLRQVETLQSQYAAASQNWQGIESTLMARITKLEKERNDAAGREAEVRKKMRDSILKAKHAERELETNSSRLVDIERDHARIDAELKKAVQRALQSEEELARIRNELDEHRISFEKEVAGRIEEEKTKWAAAMQVQRNESPVASSVFPHRRAPGYDIGHLMSPAQLDRAYSRRSSTMQAPGSNTPPGHQSATSIRSLSNGAVPETSSIVASLEQEEYFVNVPTTPASTRTASHRGVNDLISTSTVGAGPSVQLVERMSANVRRLESEKAASKDELARLSTQRDQARRETVNLMKELEIKRAVEDRLNSLEKEHRALNERHQTTLEMLGEKSELVEELKADIADVKQMYRDLVDTMGK